MQQSKRYWIAVAAAALALGGGFGLTARAEVRLPKVLASHMVLQREQPLPVWGWANPGETVTVQLDKVTRTAKANARGEWKTVLPARPAGGPFVLTVNGSSVVKCEDVMVGEVWLCSGQSNIEMGIGMGRDAAKEIAAADYPGIRLLMVPNRWTPEPQSDMDGTWKVCLPKTVAEDGWGGFSAGAYYFGRELHKRLGVAVGLIDATWGGTCIQTWTPPEGFAAVPTLKGEYDVVQMGDPRTAAHKQRLGQTLEAYSQWLTAARQAMEAGALVPAVPAYPGELLPPHDVQNATALYNGMIHPLCPFALRGAIWYQGESNSSDGMLYAERTKALVDGWRTVWNVRDAKAIADGTAFPFYFVQIAPYNYGNPRPQFIGEFWEAQAAAQQAVPGTGMIVINDIGNVSDIHPQNKQDVGQRLARWALAKTYGVANVAYSGPVFKAMRVEGDRLRLTFAHAERGLVSRDGKPLTWFEVIDADEGGFVKAVAVIDGATVVLSAPGVKHPVAMRFAWHMLAEPNLMNGDGLPAGAFRAGTLPQRDAISYVPEAKGYKLVYDLDLNMVGGGAVPYAVDHHAAAGTFDRIAYLLELQGAEGQMQYVYVSMDAFTSDAGKIGVPTAASGAHFQQNVANLNVFSNVPGIVTGTGLTGGNIEFWPNNYGQANAAKVPNASDQTYDFGDQATEPVDGYGSMQVHNHDAKQTLFAVNQWKAGSNGDVGIGNQASGNPDWTFAKNAGGYPLKRLRVLVHGK